MIIKMKNNNFINEQSTAPARTYPCLAHQSLDGTVPLHLSSCQIGLFSFSQMFPMQELPTGSSLSLSSATWLLTQKRPPSLPFKSTWESPKGPGPQGLYPSAPKNLLSPYANSLTFSWWPDTAATAHGQDKCPERLHFSLNTFKHGGGAIGGERRGVQWEKKRIPKPKEGPPPPQPWTLWKGCHRK